MTVSAAFHLYDKKSRRELNIFVNGPPVVVLVRKGMHFRPRVYRILPQNAFLPGLDAGNDGVKPALSFVLQNHQTLCSV